jgi:hypothetical protein
MPSDIRAGVNEIVRKVRAGIDQFCAVGHLPV